MRSGAANNLVLDVANAASNDVKTIVCFVKKMNIFVYKMLLYFLFINNLFFLLSLVLLLEHLQQLNLLQY